MNCWQGKLGVFGELKTLTFDLSTGKTPFHTITKMSVLSIPKVPNSSDSLSALTGELLHDLHWGWYRSLDSRLPPAPGHCQHQAPGSGQCCCLQRRVCWSYYILREGAYDCLLATSIFTQNLLRKELQQVYMLQVVSNWNWDACPQISTLISIWKLKSYNVMHITKISTFSKRGQKRQC